MDFLSVRNLWPARRRAHKLKNNIKQLQLQYKWITILKQLRLVLLFLLLLKKFCQKVFILSGSFLFPASTYGIKKFIAFYYYSWLFNLNKVNDQFDE